MLKDVGAKLLSIVFMPMILCCGVDAYCVADVVEMIFVWMYWCSGKSRKSYGSQQFYWSNRDGQDFVDPL